VTLSRLPLFFLAVVNLLLVIDFVLWAAGDLGGLDTALLQVSLSLGNPTYLTALVLLTWVLLTPFVEAGNYLLHVDARARYEGLDLWYRVRRVFPVPDKARVGAVVLAIGLALLSAAPGHAAAKDSDEQRLTAVREARQKVDAIQKEVEQAEPYPGGDRWAPRLRDVARGLDPAGSPGKGPYRWFYQAIDGFGRRTREGAVQVLTDLSRRLALAEEELSPPSDADAAEAAGQTRPLLSREEIKALVPKRDDGAGDAQAQDAADKQTRREPRRPARRDDEDAGGGGPEVRGPGLVPPQPAGGFSALGWLVVGGAALAVVLLACVLFWQTRGGPRPAAKPAETGKAAAPSLESLLTQPEPQTAQTLWRRAEDQARGGNFLEAVRCLYLAVLVQLHQARLIRYERARTNGEYVDQVRLSPDAPPELHEPFQRLTGLFELKWYGERACGADDYQTCRELAEEVRRLARG
jgi:hypothetical protein